MTEAEWLACAHPNPLMMALQSRGTDRKFRLFSTACCRMIWPLLPDPLRRAVEIAEQFADDLVGSEKLAAAYRAVEQISDSIPTTHSFQETIEWYATAAVGSATSSALAFDVDGSGTFSAWYAASAAASYAANASAWARSPGGGGRWSETLDAMKATQSHLLRCIFMCPYHRIVPDPSWGSSSAKALAGGIYAERRFADLPILADALEEAGCANQDVLVHCRHPGEHVRGCWVIDLLLVKE